LISIKIAFLVFVFFLQAVPLQAFQAFSEFSREPSDEYHLSANIVVEPKAVRPGDSFELRVWLDLDEGWHIYSMKASSEIEDYPTQIALDNSLFLGQGQWKEPKPEIIFDGALGKMVKTHKNVIEFRRFYWAPRDLKEKFYNLSGSITYRACDNRICTLPRKMTFSAPLEVLNPTMKLERPE
jgi:hypothetical protein